MNRNEWKSAVLGCVLSAIGTGSVAVAQQPANNLTEPVLRVAKNEVNRAPETAAHPLDPAIDLATKTLEQLRANIHDYTTVLVKREQINGELTDYEYMFAKVRNRKVVNNQVQVPFSVYLAFLKPSSVKGREVLFIENQNEGKLLAHEGGFKRALGTHSLEPTGFLAMNGQRYPLTDIGLENLVIKLIERGERDRKNGLCEVEFLPGAKVDKRPCTVLQVKHPDQKPCYDFHLAQVFIDDEYKIPVRYIAYNWPKDGSTNLDVIEEYTYQNLKLNVGLSDSDFDVANNAYSFHKR
jgi:Protein of unknown function (DUF1571)